MKKTLIIAEAGVNHNGDMDLARKLIDEAVAAGADIVKFQTFKAEKLVSRNARKADYQINNMSDDADTNQFNMLKKLELPYEWHQMLIDYCESRNIRFLSTPFDVESIDFLESLGIDIFKIPSGELTNLPYLKKIGSKGKTVILSTGMSNMEEVKKAVNVLTSAGTAKENITVLQCNTDYPTSFEDVNLFAMQTMKTELGIKVGYSDHTPGVEIPIAAVALGAEIIEKHFTLDRNMEGPDHKASLEPQELRAMISSIRHVEAALGDGIKRPSLSESKNISIARKSIHLAENLQKGHILSESDLTMKRPGDGITPMEMNAIIGKALSHDLPADHKLAWEDVN